MRIVIVEDELLTAEDLAETLMTLNPMIEIVKILPSVRKSIDFFTENINYDLIFSDIQLQDGQSFEIYKRVTLSTPIIFCTAYNEYALEAIKNNGIDYIIKPFSQKSIEESLKKYEKLKNNFSQKIIHFDKLQQLLLEVENRTKNSSILVYKKDAIIPVKLDEVALFFIKNEITYLITFSGNNYTIGKTLEEIDSMVGRNFYRVNRQQIINKNAIKDSTQLHRKLKVNLTVSCQEEILVSREKTTAFLAWLITR